MNEFDEKIKEDYFTYRIFNNSCKDEMKRFELFMSLYDICQIFKSENIILKPAECIGVLFFTNPFYVTIYFNMDENLFLTSLYEYILHSKEIEKEEYKKIFKAASCVHDMICYPYEKKMLKKEKDINDDVLNIIRNNKIIPYNKLIINSKLYYPPLIKLIEKNDESLFSHETKKVDFENSYFINLDEINKKYPDWDSFGSIFNNNEESED